MQHLAVAPCSFGLAATPRIKKPANASFHIVTNQPGRQCPAGTEHAYGWPTRADDRRQQDIQGDPEYVAALQLAKTRKMNALKETRRIIADHFGMLGRKDCIAGSFRSKGSRTVQAALLGGSPSGASSSTQPTISHIVFQPDDPDSN